MMPAMLNSLESIMFMRSIGSIKRIGI